MERLKTKLHVKPIEAYNEDGRQTKMHFTLFAILLVNIIEQLRMQSEKLFMNTNKLGQ